MSVSDDTVERLLQRIRELEDVVTCVEQERDEWKSAANTDVLTSLPNRRAFMSRLGERLTEPCEEDYLLAVLLVDLRDLKGINHRHGMAAADDVLKYMAQRILDSLRSDDNIFLSRPDSEEFLSRLGGDEFAILIGAKNEGMETARLISERIHKMTSGHFQIRNTDDVIPIGVSIGGCLVHASADAATLYDQAARNLEAAKEIAYEGEGATQLPIVITD